MATGERVTGTPPLLTDDRPDVTRAAAGDAAVTDARRAPPTAQAAAWLHSLAPLLIGLPVVAGVWSTLRGVLTTRHPNLGWALAVASDGKAIALGHIPYADPDHHYTGMLYAPLFPAVLAPLYRIFWWDGWPILLTIAASVVLAGIAGWLATGRPSGLGRASRVADLAVAVGVGGLSWWIVSTDYRNLLFEGRADQLAWMLALGGLVAVAIGVARRTPRVWPAVVLLTAALWTKQTTIGAALSALVLLTWWTLRGVLARRTWFRFVVAFAAANVVILVSLLLVTHGWIWYFMFVMPSRHWRDPALAPYLRELRDLALLPVALFVLTALVGLVSRPHGVRARVAGWRRDVVADLRSVRRRGGREQTRGPLDGRTALVALLVLFVICSLPPTFAGRRKQGGEANQYIGLFWAGTFLFAIAYGAARRSRLRAVAATAVVVLLFATVHVDGMRAWAERRHVALPTTHPAYPATSTSPEIRAYAATHRIYNPYLGDLDDQSFHELWPTVQNIADLLAAGERPGYLIDALTERRFDAVTPFDLSGDGYVSAFGKTEENFLWKLNRVIDSGYAPSPEVPGGFLGRRPGPTPEPWLRTCFGPFTVGGTDWLIRTGGGLWCHQPGSTVITLEETPAPVTEIRTDGAVRLQGAIALTLRAGVGAAEVVVGDGPRATTVHVAAGATPQEAVVTTTGPAGDQRVQTVPTTPTDQGPTVRIVLGGPTPDGSSVVAPIDAGSRTVVQVRATPDSRVAVDLAGFGG